MDYPNHITNHEKGKHLSYEDYILIGDHFSDVFKTITTDNGSEFARLPELEHGSHTKIYFAHPYSSWEKGSIENHNGLIRRFLPKGKRMDSYSADDILAVELWANALPRKILDYQTPEEAVPVAPL